MSCEICLQFPIRSSNFQELAISIERHGELYRCKNCGSLFELIAEERSHRYLKVREAAQYYPKANLDGIVDSPSEPPKGPNIFYRCAECGDEVPSQPQNNIRCSCGNIIIEVDCYRLMVRDFTKFFPIYRRGIVGMVADLPGAFLFEFMPDGTWKIIRR